MEYIEREKAIDEIDKWLDSVGYVTVGKGLTSYGELIGCLEDTPTADVVEVVRCKDCKYFEVYYPIKEKDKEPIKAHYCKLYNSDRKQIDFCSYGERKGIK